MLDIVRFCQTYHIPTVGAGHVRGRNQWVNLQCPQCGSSGTHGGWYLGFSLQRGNFVCWRCGSLRFWTVLSSILPNLTRQQLGKAVHEHQIGYVAPPRPMAATLRRPNGNYDLLCPPDAKPLEIAHRRYLEGRHFDPDKLTQQWGVMGTGRFAESWSWRVVFPIRSQAGQVVAWQGRSIGDGDPKYRLTPDAECLVDPHSLLYGIHAARGPTVVIVEGATGVWRLGPGTVATLGIKWRQPQLAILRTFERRFLIYDPEPAAQARAVKLAEALSLFPGATEVVDGFDTDPGDFNEDTADYVRRKLIG